MIDNPIQTNRALLTWMRPLGAGGRRDRYVIAELVQDSAGVCFTWQTKDLEAARQTGFDGYPGITLNLGTRNYEAIKVLLRRLPPRGRSDFPDFLRAFGMAPEARWSDLSLLAYTGARVVSDSDGFGVAETFDGFDRAFRYVFDVSSFRKYRDGSPDLHEGDQIRFQCEDTNAFDPQAVQVLDFRNNCLGYINRTQTERMRSWLADGQVDAHVFRINGRSSYPRLFVEADIVPRLTGTRAA
jgi:hypothetical protein